MAKILILRNCTNRYVPSTVKLQNLCDLQQLSCKLIDLHFKRSIHLVLILYVTGLFSQFFDCCVLHGLAYNNKARTKIMQHFQNLSAHKTAHTI